MKPRLTAGDQAGLTRILEKAKTIEAAMSAGDPVPEAALFEIKVLFGELQFSSEPLVARLAESADHLLPTMTLRHFLNFMIPVERLLDRNLRDDDMLVTTTDDLQKAVELRPLVLVLHNLRSAFNVGAIYRMAETLACEEVHLVGYTPGPEADGVRKTAMGTSELVKSSRFETIEHSLAMLRERDFRLVALETAPKSRSLYEAPIPARTALVVGNERFGLDFHVLDLCDEVRHIPLMGHKNSLNVGSALSAAAFEWHRQRLDER